MFDDFVLTPDDVEEVKPKSFVKKQNTGANQKPVKRSGTLGCEHCPSKLNWKHGVKPVMGTVTGKKYFVWAQCPGPQENKRGTELIGPAGDFLWKELGAVGITRDMCDVQNVVRCFTADYQEEEWPPLKMRSPSKEEIRCCSLYSEQAITKSKASVHLVFGQVAHKALLGQEYKKVRKVFFSAKLNATVFLLDHPSFFLRSGYGGKGQMRVPTDRLREFRRMLVQATSVAKQGKIDKFSYINSRDYKVADTEEKLEQARIDIRSAENRVAVDAEWGRSKDDKTVHLCVAFITAPGQGWGFVTGHKHFDLEFRKKSRAVVRDLLEDSKIRKVFHHGNGDVEEFEQLLKIKVQGYEYDTEYGEYFAYPMGKQATYGLEAIGDRRFPKFAGWKEIILPDAFKEDWLNKKRLTKGVPNTELKLKAVREDQYMKLYEAARKENGLNYAQVPWEKLILRCMADADITKRIEITTKKAVPQPLMDLYRDSAFVLGRMEREGPLYDYTHDKTCRKLYPVRVAQLKEKIVKIAGKKDFNPGSPQQLSWLLYQKLQLECPDQKKNTRKDTLKAMADQHPVCLLVNDYRRDKKIEGTYLNGYQNSANTFGGRLRTKWWLTGTTTGRLSSGGEKGRKGEDKSIVNLQNIHGDPQLQCLLISDPRWREVYKWWRARVEIERVDNGWNYSDVFTEDNWQQFENYHITLGYDFAQMELRFLAQISQDREYIKMFTDPKNDPHSMVGHALTGWSIELIKTDDRVRRIIKALHFGIVYGLQAPGMVAHLAAQGVVVTVEEMENYRKKYFAKFVGVAQWLEDQIDRVEKLKYTLDIFGQKCPVNVDEQQYMGDEYEGAFWENQAVNTPVQGGAHKMMLISVATLKRKPEVYNQLQHPQLEIHDALYFDIQLKNLWEGYRQGKPLLEKEPVDSVKKDFGYDWTMPLKAEASAGFRHGVKVKDLGEGKLTTTSAFLNKWCAKSRELGMKLQKELKAVA